MTTPAALTPSRGQAALSRAVLRALARRLRHGTLEVTEGGRESRFGSPDTLGGPPMAARLIVHDENAWRRVLARGGTGLGESYFLGEWDTDDLVGVLRVLTRNLDGVNRWSRRVGAPRRMLSALRRRDVTTKAQDRTNIAAHYDLGDEFFSLFLDPTMAYSCGVFATPASTLEEASAEKFDRICRKLDLGPADHVVEIGTGWGGFAMHAASRYGCRVTTTTISAKQFAYASQVVADAGLSDLVTVLNRDYRDLEGRFTHLVSIEMIEAVDWRQYETFFSACERLLVPEGRAALQCIVIADAEFERYKTHQDFIRRYIFPGGGLPSITAMLDAMTAATDLQLTSLEDFGSHYVRTLDEWRSALDRRVEDAASLGFDEAFVRKWRFYFAYCAAGFAERHVSVVQAVLARRGWRETRAR